MLVSRVLGTMTHRIAAHAVGAVFHFGPFEHSAVRVEMTSPDIDPRIDEELLVESLYEFNINRIIGDRARLGTLGPDIRTFARNTPVRVFIRNPTGRTISVQVQCVMVDDPRNVSRR